jgi:hypothetical protein
LPAYDVVTPLELVHNQPYAWYWKMWMSWLVTNNPESNTTYAFPDVNFLHCVSCPEENATGGYAIQPVVRMGAQAITVNIGDYVFVPIINAMAETIDNNIPDNPASLLQHVIRDLAEGDNPPQPNQATIDGNPIVNDLAPYLIISDLFPLTVLPAQEGARLLRTCLDVPINTEGTRTCVVGGWCVMIRFNTAGSYYIRTFSRGRWQYRATSFYQIDVVARTAVSSFRPTLLDPAGGPTNGPDWSKSLVKNLAKMKHTNGEIGDEQWKKIQGFL